MIASCSYTLENLVKTYRTFTFIVYEFKVFESSYRLVTLIYFMKVSIGTDDDIYDYNN